MTPAKTPGRKTGVARLWKRAMRKKALVILKEEVVEEGMRVELVNAGGRYF
ncbi:MAG: hypothetical protein LBD58_02265 [Treponema sp.]|nr:hypothetical protein [Treponema sp.]